MIVAVIPLKRLQDAKSRLTARLPQEQRADLVVSLAERTVSVLRAASLVERIALVTPEVDLAHHLGVDLVPEAESINASLSAAASWSLQAGATGLLILPGDLPLLQPNDIRELLSDRTPGISIAQTEDGGTGALFLVPPDCIAPAFGPGSYERHVEQAVRAALPVRIIDRDGLRFDLDTPADLDRLEGT